MRSPFLHVKPKVMSRFSVLFFLMTMAGTVACGQNKDPQKAPIVTTDIENFWTAFDAAKPGFDAGVFQAMYIDKGSPGLRGFMNGRIKNAANLSKVVAGHAAYYASARLSTGRIREMEGQIRASFVRMKELYPAADFPPVYFVIGALNSGGTETREGLIIGAEMYGRTADTPLEELNDWLRTVIQPVNGIPHIVAHELVHHYQKYDGGSLLAASIKEGGADYIAELISGKHINQHVHDFANPREKELWLEFKERMLREDYTGWLYSSSEGRPNDLGYWMGYKITQSFFENSPDKAKAMEEYFHIRDFEKFLAKSRYAEKFE